MLDIDDAVRSLVLDHVPKFRILVDDLTRETDEALRSRAMTAVGRIVLWCLKTARSTDDLVAGMAGWAALLRAVRRAPDGMAALALIWRYLWSVHDAPKKRVLPALSAALTEEQREDMASIADQLIEEGIEKGIEKGIERARRKESAPSSSASWNAVSALSPPRPSTASSAQDPPTWSDGPTAS